ncbi:MAG: OmpA family protein [Granulosicoccus sp.]
MTTFAVNDRNNGGQQLTLGVDVSRQLSLELHSADLGAAGLSPEGGINYNMHGANALIYAGKNRHNYKRAGFTGYGRVGYGVMESSAAGKIPYRQEESNHFLIGAGLEYMTPVGFGFRADVVSYEDDAQYAQLAIVYRMGSPMRQRGGVVVESGSDSPTNNTSEPLLQAAIAVSQELSACTMEASREGNLYFNTNSVVMSDEDRQLLSSVAQRMKSCDNLKLAITAHTDETGTTRYNDKLSKRRASVVAPNSTREWSQAESTCPNGISLNSLGL